MVGYNDQSKIYMLYSLDKWKIVMSMNVTSNKIKLGLEHFKTIELLDHEPTLNFKLHSQNTLRSIKTLSTHLMMSRPKACQLRQIKMINQKT